MATTLQRIAATPGLEVQVAVTGTHLSAEHGRTVDEVRASGLPVMAEIPLDVLTRSGASMALAIADVLRGLTPLVERERPDALLLLGDRGEMLAGAIAALHVGVPCVHVHGGERSGTVDEPVRHARSASSRATTSGHAAGARERLRAMGEPPGRIVLTGAPGLDGIERLASAPRGQLLAEIGFAGRLRLRAGIRSTRRCSRPSRGGRADPRRPVRLARTRTARRCCRLDLNSPMPATRGILQAPADLPLPAGSWPGEVPAATFARFSGDRKAMPGVATAMAKSAIQTRPAPSRRARRLRQRRRGEHRRHPYTCANTGPTWSTCRPIRPPSHRPCANSLGHGRWPCDNPWGDGRAGERIAQALACLPLDRCVLEKTNSY